MKKLNDIDKKQVFEVPEGYFDQLPLRIQKRLETPQRTVAWFQLPVMRYAVPVVVLMVAGLFWIYSGNKSIEEQLSAIDDSELVAYLQESDLNSEELEEAFQLDEQDVLELQTTMFNTLESSEEVLEELIDDYTIEAENF